MLLSTFTRMTLESEETWRKSPPPALPSVREEGWTTKAQPCNRPKVPKLETSPNLFASIDYQRFPHEKDGMFYSRPSFIHCENYESI